MSETIVTAKRGRLSGPAAKKTTILLEPDLLEWGKEQPGGLSELVRRPMRAAYEQSIPSATDAYWLRLADEGDTSGYLTAEETMRYIQERLSRDEHQNPQASS